MNNSEDRLIEKISEDIEETASIHEALDKTGAMDPDIKPLASTMELCGPAKTVKCFGRDNLTLHKALHEARENEVLVVNVVGYKKAGHWGELTSLDAINGRLGGLVIDGLVRDSNAICSLNFPVFSRGV